MKIFSSLYHFFEICMINVLYPIKSVFAELLVFSSMPSTAMFWMSFGERAAQDHD